jgi:hypothetical protein
MPSFSDIVPAFTEVERGGVHLVVAKPSAACSGATSLNAVETFGGFSTARSNNAPSYLIGRTPTVVALSSAVMFKAFRTGR